MKWINIEESAPPVDKPILIYYEDEYLKDKFISVAIRHYFRSTIHGVENITGYFSIADGTNGYNQSFYGMDISYPYDRDRKVTHWMELPSEPKDNNEMD